MNTLRCGDKILDLSRPVVMGIVNATPDSFSDGGQLFSGSNLQVSAGLKRAEFMAVSGAKIIDVGGESTRPGAKAVSLQEELDRVLPLVEVIAAELDVVSSVDTSSPEVMRASASAGAGMINDVRALQREGALVAASATGLPVCLMHMQGEPACMQDGPVYNDVVGEVELFFRERLQAAEASGIPSSRVLLDPGFGFGKTTQHNLALLKRMKALLRFGCPLVAGLSRKSVIGSVLGRNLDQRLAGSLALAMMAAQNGASIVRVHDVSETVDVLSMLGAVSRA